MQAKTQSHNLINSTISMCMVLVVHAACRSQQFYSVCSQSSGSACSLSFFLSFLLTSSWKVLLPTLSCNQCCERACRYARNDAVAATLAGMWGEMGLVPKVMFNVPVHDTEEAKELGARFCWEQKRWWVPPSTITNISFACCLLQPT